LVNEKVFSREIAMRTKTVTDNRTGEVLDIEYDTVRRIYSINGTNVVRQQALEAPEDMDEFVFSPNRAGPQKLYHVLAQDIRDLWET
jgi:hypothetical protein